MDEWEGHPAADGSGGWAVGDDSGLIPRVVVPQPRCLPWWVSFAVVSVTLLLIAALLAASPVAAALMPHPDRTAPCRCGDRPAINP